MPTNSATQDCMPNITLILMAAGESRRFSQSFAHLGDLASESTAHNACVMIKKQWLRIGNKPLWLFVADTLNAMYPFVQICIAGAPDEVAYMQKLCTYTITEGGSSRQESVKKALEKVQSEWVLIHDVARFCVPESIIYALINTLKCPESNTNPHTITTQDRITIDCVVPTLGVCDTILYNGEYIDREKILRIQTPQLSRTAVLQKALDSQEGSDESSIIKAFGGKVVYIQGDERLEKITFAKDIQNLEFNTSFSTHSDMHYSYEPNLFIGNGLDVHGFDENKVMKLGGITISNTPGFKAHSDGDVALHSLIDAILGAMGGGDIGEWFPDSDIRFKEADSSELLAFVWHFARSVGFTLHNVDITIIAQRPKLSSYKQTIRANIARILNAPLSHINIKATTTENLGFIGRSEGVCVMCSVTLRLITLSEVVMYFSHMRAKSSTYTSKHLCRFSPHYKGDQ